MIGKASDGDASGLVRFKSSYSSGPDGDSCVEIAATPTTIHIRDSKNPPSHSPNLTFPSAAWTAFLSYAATGE
ncbi:uncharacterized protein DUF397 [Streptomyces sp. Ag109_O5-1]|uniref:DUF397 domain-containing protein n=1 Tax=Streptomyces sp. Ag109_O5-1 TaxID=1938851 RepID=UPI000F50635C|nr:DUF397 domain-containing protein [Streptomyces sp. Ag109_O5-1]RPE41494.1 uncharacterized protein DUF397 [Streptomyces sp. Ag109_O5-1]